MLPRAKEMCYELSTELLEALYRIWRKTIAPHSGGPLKSGDKGPTHNAVGDSLQAHDIAILLPMVHRVGRAVVRFQRWEFETSRYRAGLDLLGKRRFRVP